MLMKAAPIAQIDSWEPLLAMIESRSVLELGRLPFSTPQEAMAFISQYGYDLNDNQHLEELLQLSQEATLFITQQLLDEADGLKLPNGLDIHPVSLLLLASDPQAEHRFWACAILKVLHTLVHIQHSALYTVLDVARSQILKRFEAVLSLAPGGQLTLGKPNDSQSLPLVGFEVKDQKARHSILMKLLYKKENIAEAVYDMVGIRLIVYTPAEAVVALDLLRQLNILLPPNIIPGRSRNSLLNVADFQQCYQTLQQQQPQALLSSETFRQAFGHLSAPGCVNSSSRFAHNSATAETYRSIHVTARQLIRLKQPMQDLRMFFPFEVQILDEASYIESQEGTSAHAQYKKRQRDVVRQRILAPLLT